MNAYIKTLFLDQRTFTKLTNHKHLLIETHENKVTQHVTKIPLYFSKRVTNHKKSN